MAAETASIQDKTRRVKDHILTRDLALADNVDKGKPWPAKTRSFTMN
jgi:hypothetical protein